MKTAVYLFVLILPLALMNISCKKDSPTPDVAQNLNQKYPDWKFLTWVSTDGTALSTTYPRLNISINKKGDILMVNQQIGLSYGINVMAYSHYYTSMEITGDSVIIGNKNDGVRGKFIKIGSQITLNTYGLLSSKDSVTITSHVYFHTYILNIN